MIDHEAFAERLDAAATELATLVRAASRGTNVRAQVDDVVARINLAVIDRYGKRPRAARGQGAQWKMLEYLQARPTVWIHGDELAQVARTKSWARRLRQLRVEHGYLIEESEGRYMLADVEPSSSEEWRLANRIRRSGGSGKGRIAAYFEASVGEVLDRNKLDYVANEIKEGTRRARELRDEQGWPIESHIDNPSLKEGEYRLLSKDSADRRDPRQRLFKEKLRASVFKRDGYVCRECGRDKGAAEAAGQTRFYLEAHHLTAVAEDLDALSEADLNTPANLITLCHQCHAKATAEFQARRRKERAERPRAAGD